MRATNAGGCRYLGRRVEATWGTGRIIGGTRLLELAADNREAALGKGVRSSSTIAHEVDHTYLWGLHSTPTTRRIAAARGAARLGGVDFRSILERPGKLVRRILVKTFVPGTFEVGAHI
jgi:hypothetical protein